MQFQGESIQLYEKVIVKTPPLGFCIFLGYRPKIRKMGEPLRFCEKVTVKTPPLGFVFFGLQGYILPFREGRIFLGYRPKIIKMG